MVRVKIIKDGQYKAGDIVSVSRNEAHSLIEAGVAMITKDMVQRDIKTKDVSKPLRKRHGRFS